MVQQWVFENGQGGALCDTAMIICKGCVKTVKGGALYDTAMIICKGCVKMVKEVHYMTLL